MAPSVTVRVCRLHGQPCREDPQKDIVTCPGGGGHRVKPGEWYTASAGGAGGTPDELVQRQVGRALELAKGNRHRAIQALIEEAERNLPLRNALLLPYLGEAAARAIARRVGDGPEEHEALGPRGPSRLEHPTRPQPAAVVSRPPRSDGDRGLQLVAAFNEKALLEHRIGTGLRLRSATRTQVLEAAERSFAGAHTGVLRGRWLKLVGEAIPDGAKVHQVLDQAGASRLLEQARIDIDNVSAQLGAAPPRLLQRSR